MIGKMTKTALMLWCEVEGNLFGDDMWEERTRKGAQKDYQLLIKRLSDMSLIDCEIFCERRGGDEAQECVGCIRKDLVEIRSKVGSDISRVLYFFCYDGKIILTNGFVKKTQKTPRIEITRAKKI